jgi:hypothetical protein
MGNTEFNNIDIYKRAILIERIGNTGVQKALEENRKLGIPSVYTINGRIIYELADGSITELEPKVFLE